jgi:CRP/FNR family transcriptional regulator
MRDAAVIDPDVYRPAGMAEDEWHEMISSGVRRRMSDGQLICSPGDTCKGWPFVLEGAIRMYTMSEGGREMTLYRLGVGDACFLSVSCLLGAQQFPAFAAATGDTEIMLLSPDAFRIWFDRSSVWRRHVCGTLAGRFVDVIATLREIAFRRVDSRVAAYLIENGTEGLVTVTHAALARDLGTSREVVSRILKEFEQEGLVGLQRGQIVVEDAPSLSRIAGSSAFQTPPS